MNIQNVFDVPQMAAVIACLIAFGPLAIGYGVANYFLGRSNAPLLILIWATSLAIVVVESIIMITNSVTLETGIMVTAAVLGWAGRTLGLRAYARKARNL